MQSSVETKHDRSPAHKEAGAGASAFGTSQN